MKEVLLNLANELKRGLDILDTQLARAGEYAPLLDRQLRQELSPQVTALFLPEADSDGTCAARNVEAVARTLAQTVKDLGVERHPRVPQADLLAIQKLCDHTKKQPSKLALYKLVSGKMSEELVVWSCGMTTYVTFERPMMLGILHLFTIRGFGTLFSNLGVLAWSLGVGEEFTEVLKQARIYCNYYEQYGTMKFGGIKSKGHDSLRILMEPTKFAAVFGLYAPYVERILSLWCGYWFLVSNPWLEQTFFPELPSERRRSAAEDLVRRVAQALNDLIHGVFGDGAIHTPSIHTVLHDVPHNFCDLHEEMFFGNEQAVESAQQMCRELLATLQSAKNKNTEMVRPVRHG